MADKLADLSPEEKEKRIAEMKAKMQAAAAKSKAASGEAEKPKASCRQTAKQAPKPPVSSGEAAIVAAAATAKEARAVPAEASPAVIEAVDAQRRQPASCPGRPGGRGSQGRQRGHSPGRPLLPASVGTCKSQRRHGQRRHCRGCAPVLVAAAAGLCRGDARAEGQEGDESPRVPHLCVGRRAGLAAA